MDRSELITDWTARIGEPFKVNFVSDGALGAFDTIREVRPDGTVIGDFIEADIEAVRLKGPQPEQFKKDKHEQL